METGSELLTTGLLILAALCAGRLASALGLPRVAAYLLVGVLLSPGVSGDRLGLQVDTWLESFSLAALGIIAYLIGGSMTVAQLRRMGRVIGGSTLGQSLGAMLFVFASLWGLLSLQAVTSAAMLALVFGVLAISTAPAATLAIVHQYRSKGPVTDTLLGVVALDDAVGIIAFSVVLAFAADHTLTGSLASAAMATGGGLLTGAVAGWILFRASTVFGESGLRLPLILSTVLVVVGIAHSLDLSLLLAAMSLGFFTRFYSHASARRLFKPVYRLEETIFLLFFTLAGTQFDFAMFQQHLDLILVYVAARFAGKVLGSGAGAKLVGAPEDIVRWLGFGLVPQAGIAVGLALILQQQGVLADNGDLVINVILGTTLVYELIGPLAVQFALKRVGEIHAKREKHRHAGF